MSTFRFTNNLNYEKSSKRINIHSIVGIEVTKSLETVWTWILRVGETWTGGKSWSWMGAVHPFHLRPKWMASTGHTHIILTKKPLPLKLHMFNFHFKRSEHVWYAPKGLNIEVPNVTWPIFPLDIPRNRSFLAWRTPTRKEDDPKICKLVKIGGAVLWVLGAGDLLMAAGDPPVKQRASLKNASQLSASLAFAGRNPFHTTIFIFPDSHGLPSRRNSFAVGFKRFSFSTLSGCIIISLIINNVVTTYWLISRLGETFFKLVIRKTANFDYQNPSMPKISWLNEPRRAYKI